MSTHPYIPLYVDDYDAHTSHLSPAEDGVYGRLLRLAWRTPGCSLPNDPAWLSRKLRLSEADFAAIAQPVIDEFFKVLRGRLVQGRLKSEYDNISRKKTARKLAGKKGGDAKALKKQEKASSNATFLPADAGAFPNPEPEPIEGTPIAPKGAEPEKPIRLRKADVEAVWSITPKESKERSSRADVEKALVSAARRGHAPDDILVGLAGYFASDQATKDGGAFVKGVHRMIERDRWQVFAEVDAPLLAAAEAPKPADVWARRIHAYRQNAYWNRLDWGPPPGKPGCTIPDEVLMTAGYVPTPITKNEVAA